MTWSRIGRTTVAGALVLGALLVAPPAQATTQSGSVTVRLGYHNDPFGDEDALLDVGSACAGLTVGIYSRDGVKLMSAVTDAAGKASFASITDGVSYEVRLETSGCTNVPGSATLVGFADEVGTGDSYYWVNGSSYPLNPTILVGYADTDQDGLDDHYEASTSKTSPTSADTDGDRRTDFNELDSYYWSNPLVTDTDGDGYADYVEFTGEAYPCGEYDYGNVMDPNDPLEHPSISVGSWGQKTGKPRVGKKVRVGGIQPCTGVSVSTQWYVKNKAVRGATGRELKISKRYRGKPVSVRVTMSYPEFPSESTKIGFGRVPAKR